jgi:DNA polymerase
LYIGEAPGASEDVLRKPFCGPAGTLLDDLIHDAQTTSDNFEPYALTNLIACIPLDETNNKISEPTDKQIKACKPRLQEFVDLCKPSLIVAVGKLAAKHLEGASGCALDHPAYLLRLPIAQRGLAYQRNVVNLSDALGDLLNVD